MINQNKMAPIKWRKYNEPKQDGAIQNDKYVKKTRWCQFDI